jgi:hypothetical protein
LATGRRRSVTGAKRGSHHLPTGGHPRLFQRSYFCFGSDYPLIRPERWIKDFQALEIRDEVEPLIMKENAIHALGLR